MVKTLGIIGAILFGVGLIAGFAPFTSGYYYCGSAFVPSSPEQEFARASELNDEEPGLFTFRTPPESFCDELRMLVRIPAFGLASAGGVALISCWYIATQAAGRARAGRRTTTRM